MLANSGHWTIERFVDVERRRIERQRREAETRREHRSLDRRARLLADLEAVDKELHAHLLKSSALATRGTTLLRRRNKLVDALNAFVGTSQKVNGEDI